MNRLVMGVLFIVCIYANDCTALSFRTFKTICFMHGLKSANLISVLYHIWHEEMDDEVCQPRFEEYYVQAQDFTGGNMSSMQSDLHTRANDLYIKVCNVHNVVVGMNTCGLCLRHPRIKNVRSPSLGD